MAEIKPRYLIFDVESVADGEAILKAKYSAELKAGQNVTPKEAITRFRKERLDERVLTLFLHVSSSHCDCGCQSIRRFSIARS